jgi:hypothetical protein
MATTLNAGTTTATALNVITDTTGAMAIQTSGTTAIAINNAQVVSLTNPLLPASGGTGITSLGTGVATFLGTPTSANLAATVTDETGTGSLVFANSPTLTGTPLAPTATAGTNTTQIATTAFVQNVAGALGTMSTQNANAVAITGGAVTGITDLAVADGGTGASTFTTNSVVLGNGTSSLAGNMVAPSTAGKVLVSNGTTWTAQTITASGIKLGLGITGETWHDVTGSRSQGVYYTNSYGYPIQVVGNFGCNGGGQGLIYIDGVLIAYWQAQFNGCGGYSVNMPCIVPAGSTYLLTGMNGSTRGWYELY